MIKIINLSKKYKSKEGVITSALNNINLNLPSSGIIFLTGKSGSGKTTLLNLIGGMDIADSGEIIIHNKSDKDFKASDYDTYRNNYVGFVFQDFCILEDYTVAENIALAFGLQGREATRQEVEAILCKVDLDGYYDRKPNELSGGQKQRVAIARALIKNPEIIIADEPTGNLDSTTGTGIFELLHKLSEERLVIVVSHDRDSAYEYGDRIISLSDGSIESDEINSKDIPIDAITIDGKKIYLPKRKMTSDELSKIAKAMNEGKKIAKRSSLTISEEDIMNDNKAFKAVKNHLPIKTAYNLGIAGIKSRPGRVVIIVILMILAFTMLGTVSVAFFFDKDVSLSKVLDKSGTDYALLRYGANEDDYTGLLCNNNTNISYNKYLEIMEQYDDLSMLPIYDIRTQYPSNSTSHEGLSFKSVSGLIVLPHDKLSYLDYTIAYGEYPEANSDAIAITDYLADILIDAELYTSYSDILTKGYDNYKGYTISISGIIDTNYKVKYEGVYDGNEYAIDYTERTMKYKYERSKYYSLFYTSDISSADTIISSMNVNYSIIDIEDSFSNTAFIGKESLLQIMLDVEDQELTYFEPLVEPTEIVLSGNDVIVDYNFYAYISNFKPINLPYEAEFQGIAINIVGVLRKTNPGISADRCMFTDDNFYNNFESNDIELKGIFTDLYDNSDKNADLFNNLYGERIINDTYYSSMINDVYTATYILRYVLLGLGGFFMIYSVIMLFNFISSSVNEKSKDIGILRAIGARSSDTAAIYLVEALFIAIVSALVSYLAMLGSIAILNKAFIKMIYYMTVPDLSFTYFNLDIISMSIVLALSIFVATCGALIPVARLAHMRPVDAIKKN